MGTAGDHHGPVAGLQHQGLFDDGPDRASRVHAGQDLEGIVDLNQLGLSTHLLFEGLQ